MEIDLNNITTYGKYAAIGGLSLAGIWALLWPLIKKWLNDRGLPTKTRSTVTTTSVVSGTEVAPSGFQEYTKIILEASKHADLEIRLTYLLLGLSEEDVLRREVERMGSAQKSATSSKIGG